MLVGMPEFIDNPEPRCPCLLLTDCSGSMTGDPIRELNQGLEVFQEQVQNDPLASLRVEVAVITFGGDARLKSDFQTVDLFDPPRLSADGGTPMGQAIRMGVEALETRKAEYKTNGIQYYRPWILLITDGAPTDDWQSAAHQVHQGESEKKFSFFAVGVEGACMDTLRQIAPPNRPPLMLKGLQFGSMFTWLSASLRRVADSQTGGEQVALAPIDGWAQTST